MSKLKYALLLGICLLMYKAQAQSNTKASSFQTTTFAQELKQLKKFFKIPGMAILVKQGNQTIYEDYTGWANVAKKTPMKANTLVPIASLTKIFGTVLIFKLEEEGKLSLDEPLLKYFPKQKFTNKILIKHVLSHTSQGDIGQHFYYSSRFGALTRVIEKASGMSFQQYLEKEIIKPLKLKNTFVLKSKKSLNKRGVQLATPYQLSDKGKVKKGKVEYGFSTSAGIVSTPRDLAIFNEALDNNQLISAKSRTKMTTAFKNSLPYGYGIFSQQFAGKKLVWGYGQYDCYSGLYLKIPAKNLTLFLLANNNLMSDPPRMIYGDVTSSLFALSFLKNFVFGFDKMPLMQAGKVPSKKSSVKGQFYRKKLLAHALASSFMARYDKKHFDTSVKLLTKVFAEYPDYEGYGNLNLMHNLLFLKDVTFYRNNTAFNDFDTQIKKIGEKLLTIDPQNPYANVYMGSFYARNGKKALAKPYYAQIIKAKNFSKNWYIFQAQRWINKYGN